MTRARQSKAKFCAFRHPNVHEFYFYIFWIFHGFFFGFFRIFIMCINWFIRSVSLQFALHVVRGVVLSSLDTYTPCVLYIRVCWLGQTPANTAHTPTYTHTRTPAQHTHTDVEWTFSSGGSSAYDGVSKTKFIHFPTARRCLKNFKIFTHTLSGKLSSLSGDFSHYLLPVFLGGRA